MAGRGAGVVAGALLLAGLAAPAAAGPRVVRWRHLSTQRGPRAPERGGQQTSLAVADFDGDGVNDFVVTERTQAPSVVLYLRGRTAGRTRGRRPTAAHRGRHRGLRHRRGRRPGPSRRRRLGVQPGVVVRKPLAAARSGRPLGAARRQRLRRDQAPRPALRRPRRRRTGRARLLVPGRPVPLRGRHPGEAARGRPVAVRVIYSWSDDSEMRQRQTRPYPGFKAANEHEGLAAVDVDVDGKLDLVGGGRWFKHLGGTTYEANLVDAAYPFTRVVAGQFVEGGRPEVVLTVGDGWAPMMLYEWQKGSAPGGTWVPKSDPPGGGLHALAPARGLRPGRPPRHLGRRDAAGRRQPRREEPGPVRRRPGRLRAG